MGDFMIRTLIGKSLMDKNRSEVCVKEKVRSVRSESTETEQSSTKRHHIHTKSVSSSDVKDKRETSKEKGKRKAVSGED
ncbi:hypothetical protein Btru_075687 [Bulinus truncatus]|nr:hypothetical protein Btru_075687 [Bulinus truncatus]